jgi:hypothetical protein
MVRVWVVDVNIFKNQRIHTLTRNTTLIPIEMSRAPAPMKTAETVTATDPSMNPYNMSTYGMMNFPTPQQPMGTATPSPVHAMQNLYTNMQQQQQQMQLQQQQQQHMLKHQQTMQPFSASAPTPSTTQNVSVVDFKPDVMAQHQVAQMQQQFQNHMASMNTANTPSLGVIGPDGCYVPATAAAPYDASSNIGSPQYTSSPYTASPYNTASPYASPYTASPYGAKAYGASPYDASPHTASPYGSSHYDMKNPYGVNVPTTRGYRPPPRGAIRHCNSINRDSMSRGCSSEFNKPTTTRDVNDLIDERLRMHKASTDATAIVAKNEATANATATAAAAAAASAPVVSHRAIKDMIDHRVESRMNKAFRQSPQIAAQPIAPVAPTTMSNTTEGGFHTKPQEEQRRIVGDAVRSVMSKYNVTPKDRDPITSSSYTPRNRTASKNDYNDMPHFDDSF